MPPGFTLIELLLALGIFATLAVTLYVTFANGIAINRKASELEDFYREARWAVDTLTSELENMVNYKYLDFYNNEQGGFKGDASSLSLISSTGDGIRWVRYQLKDSDYGHIHTVIVQKSSSRNVSVVDSTTEEPQVQFLVRKEGPLPHLFKPEKKGGDEEILSRHVKAGGLKFYYAFKDLNQPKSALVWREQWTSANHPAGVRVELTFLHPQGASPPLYVKKDILIPTGYWGEDEAGQ